MCEECFQEWIYKFPTHQDFERFENILQLKCTEGKLKILDKHETDYLSAFDSNLYFECRTCKEVWILNIPDNVGEDSFYLKTKHLITKGR